MSITVDQMAEEIRTTLKNNPSREGKEQVCKIVSRALLDQEFVAEHLKDRAAGEHPREVLYEDDELGFCICGHVYGDEAVGEPHDHGSSWAIYGQAIGQTEMTDWEIVDKGGDSKPILVKPEKRYILNPGDAYFYDVGDVHSPKRLKPTKLIRIEGANLDHVRRSNIKAA